MTNIYTIRSGASQHPEKSFLQWISDQVAVSGVLDIIDDFLVAQQASPDMTVLVGAGRAYIKGALTSGYPVNMDDGTNNVTIGNNSSGNPRIDAIVAYIDLSATPAVDGSGVAKLVAVAGTPAASPSAPDDAAILTAIGSSNPYIRLANVTVASGATTIVTANITDTRVPVFFVNQIKGDWIDITDGSIAYVDLNQPTRKKMYRIVLTASGHYIMHSNEIAGPYILRIEQDSTGSRTAYFPHKATTFATTDVNAGTDVITVGRSIKTGTPIMFSSTTTLPAGLAAATRYYAINQSATTIKVATTLANAQAGTAINITDQGTGTHSVSTETKWGSSDTVPTLSTGKYQADEFAITVDDAVNGIYSGRVIAQDL